jgi:hypothetical protein
VKRIRFWPVGRLMCDALSRNTPKLTNGVQILLANCLEHAGEEQLAEAKIGPQESARRFPIC